MSVETEAKTMLKNAVESNASTLFLTDGGMIPISESDTMKIVVVKRSDKEILSLVDRFKKGGCSLRYALSGVDARTLADRLGFKGCQSLNVSVRSGSVVLFVRRADNFIIDTNAVIEDMIQGFEFKMCVCG